jgi:tetratricopeptide (TPR) repeat protein
MQDLWQQGVQLHRLGQLAEASQLYERALAQDGTNVDALHLLGVVRHQQGQHQSAVELISRAIAIRGDVAAFHVHLAEAHRALRQFEQAVACCGTALELFPDNPEALCADGLALQGLDRREEAVKQFRRAIEARPNFAAAHHHLGVVLCELGRHDEAAAQLCRAVELDQAHAPTLIHLGRMLLERSRAAEALRYLEAAVRMQPKLAELRRNLGNALHGLGRLERARDAYVDALGLDANLVAAQANLALVLEQEGHLDDALDWLEKAVAAQPANPLFWHQLAELHERRRESTAAASCWDRLLNLAPGSARGHIAVGRALQKKGRTTEAADHFRAALGLHPGMAEAYDSLGKLHQELGELDEAEAAIRTSRRLQPAAAEPHRALAMLLAGNLPTADLKALEARASDPQLDDETRGHLLFALAHVLDARGQYAEVAECSNRANQITLARAARLGRAYVSEAHERFVDGVLAAFGKDFFARLRGAGLTTRRPVFVFGLPRSGTSVVEQILASHGAVHGAGELLLAPQTFEAIPSVVGCAGPPLDCVDQLSAASVARLAEAHLEALQRVDGDRSQRIVDKGPENYQFVGLLATLFPQATFIHCRRNLRDVAVSCWLTDFEQVPWAQDPGHIAAHFRQHRRLMEHWRAVLPGSIHEVDYEQTVADLEGTARGLVAACGLEWDEACLNFHRTRRAVRTSSATQVRQPIYTRSVERWKHYEAHLGRLFAHLPVE